MTVASAVLTMANPYPIAYPTIEEAVRQCFAEVAEQWATNKGGENHCCSS